jgi:hypothetical protein
MSSLAEEDDAGIRLVIRAHRDLKTLNPNHDLVKLIEEVHDGEFTASEEFNKRYVATAESKSYESVMLARLQTTGHYENDLIIAIRNEIASRFGNECVLPDARLEQKEVLDVVRRYSR